MDAHRVAFNTWQEKTEWVQKDKRFDILLPWGKHRADVLKEYIDHLEARCAALAAENAGLKAENAEGCKWVGLFIETPTTDAFLAEVRASELDSLAGVAETMLVKFANQGVSDIPESKGWEMIFKQASQRAAKLRKGVQS